MLLSVAQVAKTWGALHILTDISFILNDAERVGLVGANGTGKSTLFRIITSELEADSGQIVIPNGTVVGYCRSSHRSRLARRLMIWSTTPSAICVNWNRACATLKRR